MASQSKKKTSPHRVKVGIDFATTHLSVGVTYLEQASKRSIELELGQQNEGDGLVPKWRLPVHVEFTEEGICAVGFEAPRSPERTSHGLKQAMLISLYEAPDGEGKRFLDLCRQYAKHTKYIQLYPAGSEELRAAALLDAAYVLHFRFLWDKIQRWLGERGLSVDEICIAMPAITFEDSDGKAIRDRILRCAAEAGMPIEKMITGSEEECAMAYFFSTPSWIEIPYRWPRKVALVEFGGGTTEIIGLEVSRDGHVKPIHGSIGCTGGIADVESDLWTQCVRRKASFTTFRDVKRHLHKLRITSDDLEQEGVVFRARTLQAALCEAYREPIKILLEFVEKCTDLALVVVSSVAVSSNVFLSDLVQRRLQQTRPGLGVHILAPEDAKRSVHLGASMPYAITKSAFDLFVAHSFGTLERFEGGAGDSGKNDRLPVLEQKKSCSTKLESIPETFDYDGEVLCVRPHTFYFPAVGKGRVRRKPARVGPKSVDTFRFMLSRQHAVPMGAIFVDLSGHVGGNNKVKTTWVWGTPNPGPLLTLRVTCPDGFVIDNEMQIVRTRFSVRLELIRTSRPGSVWDMPPFPAQTPLGGDLPLAFRKRLPSRRQMVPHEDPEGQNVATTRVAGSNGVDTESACADAASVGSLEETSRKRKTRSWNDTGQQPRSYQVSCRSSPSSSLQDEKDHVYVQIYDEKFSKLGTTVLKADLSRLEGKAKLNDSLLWFYLAYLFNGWQDSGGKPRICMLNSFFYTNLESSDANVRAWMTKIDLRSFDYVVLPIHDINHWYLALICDLGRLAGSDDAAGEGRKASLRSAPTRVQKEALKASRSRTGQVLPGQKGSGQRSPETLIITLDSLAMPRAATGKLLRAHMEQQARMEDGALRATPIAWMAANVPLQTNEYECGYHVLNHVSEFLQDPDGFVQKLRQENYVERQIDVAEWRLKIRAALDAVHQNGGNLIMS